jgi:GT2 family glycosyltransferase
MNHSTFDQDWYSSYYRDVELSKINAEQHYEKVGKFIGRFKNITELAQNDGFRKINPRFCPDAYRLINSDLDLSNIDPTNHYAVIGYKDNRIGNWLDRYIEIYYGKMERIRISSIINYIINDNEDNIEKLEKRLKKELRNKRNNLDANIVATVIIPVYNQVKYTLASLISLYESRPKTSFEVIIADDCSTDQTFKLLNSIDGNINVIRTKGNLGFLRNCNHAAKKANGDILVFLNNDMVVFPGWLDELVDTIQENESYGMVGSKLLNLNGTLQEAGGIFWNDGSAWNYGRNQDPQMPEFNYKKEVDYCSGASICLRKKVWDSMEGFDEIYTPAYYEESDLAFRLRSQGLKTIYQPFSVGVHLEGISCGTDLTKGIKSSQIVNSEKFVKRWDSVLQTEHYKNAENVFIARDRSACKPHMLFVDHYVPQPDKDAGSKQTYTYLELFLEMGYQITFWPDNQYWCSEYALPLQRMGIEIINGRSNWMNFSDWIKSNGEYIDIAFLSRPHIAIKYFESIKRESATKIIYYGHDLHQERGRLQVKIEVDNTKVLAELEDEVVREELCWINSNLVMYPSQSECDFVNGKFPNQKTAVLPLYCISDYQFESEITKSSYEEREGLIFVGGFIHPPNKDGIIWFCKKIFPLITKDIKDLKLTIIGSNPTSEILELNSNSVVVRGWVSDEELHSYYNKSRIAVAPLRFGAGVKGKVVESLLKGVPMVTTEIGIQGIDDMCNGIICASNEEEYAAEIIDLYKNRGKWCAQREKGVQLLKRNFSKTKVLEHLTNEGFSSTKK